MKAVLLSVFFLAGAAAAPPIVVHAHRGAMAVLPENTIPAFREAIRLGADYIELDVLVTSDGVPVITHDPVVNPAICRGPWEKRAIREMTFEEVRRYDCGSLTLPGFPRQVAVPGTPMPTLDEVLELGRSSSIRFNIEIKSSSNWREGWTPPAGEHAGIVVAAVRKHRLETRVLVQSFDFRVVKAVKEIAPELALAALYSGDRSFVDIARETGVRMVNPAFRQVTKQKVEEAHAAGIQIVPWTIDEPEDWDAVLEAGVDGIITNDPAMLIAHLKARGRR